MSIIGGSGVSSHIAPSARARVLARTNHDPQPHDFQRLARCPLCSWEGIAWWTQVGSFFEAFSCPREDGGCGEVVVTEDEPTDDGLDPLAPHVDDDGLWPPQSLTDREAG